MFSAAAAAAASTTHAANEASLRANQRFGAKPKSYSHTHTLGIN